MRKRIIQMPALIFALSLLMSLTSSLVSRTPEAQERLIPPRRHTSKIRAAHSAQASWVQNYGRFFDDSNDDYDWLFDAQPAWDGGLVLTGTVSHTFLSGRVVRDALVMEIGPSGGVVWEVLHEAGPHVASYNSANALTRTRDVGYLVVGRAEKFNSLDNALLVLKVVPPPGLPDGGRTPYYHYALGPEWVRSYIFVDQGDASTYADPMDVVETADGGYVIGGLWGSSGGGSYWLMKLDPLGNVLWHEDIRPAVASLVATPDAGFIAAGDTNEGDAVQVVKFDSDGRIQWAKTYKETDTDWGYDDYVYHFSGISSTMDGGYVLAGDTTGFDCCNDDTTLAWLCKLDPDGSIAWSKGYNISEIGPILQTADGGYLMPLSSYSSELMKVDALGSIEWVRSYSGLYPAVAFQSEDGGYMVAGEAEARLMVMRIDSAGHLDSSCSIETHGSVTTREARISAVSTTLPAPSENSVQVNVLETAPYPRTCVIRDLCPGSQSTRSRQAGKPVGKKSPSLN